MRIEFDKQWCLRMAQLELESGADVEAGHGSTKERNESNVVPIADVESLTEVNIAFGRFVRLMRRKKRLTLEELSEHADVEISELVEVEDDARHKPDPRTVFQLSKVFNIPTSKLMQVAGLSVPRDARLVHEAIRFAARSEPLDELTEAERAALDAFVSVLGNQS